MDRFGALLAELVGSESQGAFARRIGIEQPHVSRLLRGVRTPGPMVILLLLQAFPERHREILDAGLAAMTEAAATPAGGPEIADIRPALYPTADPCVMSISA